MTTSTLHRPLGSATGPEQGDVVRLTPADAGWTYCGLQVLELGPGRPRTVLTGDSEVFVLPLAGGLQLQVRAAGEHGEPEARFQLDGRESVFTRVTDFAYAGRDCELTLTSAAGATVAIPSAVCRTRLPARYGPADQVPVETRGAGPASRQVTNFGVPGVWEHAENLICCELITPDGNWSSYPSHKHDATQPCPVVNEEIYYYRIAGPDQVTPSRQGYGQHRTYTTAEHEAAGLAPLDEAIEVRDHDVVLIPHGYHGPCMAAPGYPMYYLNVMAGPAERVMQFCDDPDHTWLRGAWAQLPVDPRCPVTTAAGRTGHGPATDPRTPTEES